MDLKYLLKILKSDDVDSFVKEVNGKYNEIFQLEKNGEKLPPLIFAVRYNAKNIFNKLIKEKNDINIKGEYNWTPLLEAILDKNLYFINKLVELGADIELCGGKATTWPLIEAILSGNIEMLRIILSKASKNYIEWGFESTNELKIENKNEVLYLLQKKLNDER
jgi:ankyrin repeat protein